MKNINIYDVAQKAGVSISTVSRVLNDYSYVKTETKKKVLAVMNKMNYQPSTIARMLGGSKPEKLTKKNCISIAISKETDINSPTFYGFLTGIMIKTNELGLGFFTDSIETEYRKTISLPSSVKNNSIDGVIVIGRLNLDFIRELTGMKLPIVTIGQFYPDMDVDVVFTDDIKGSNRAVKYLIEKGHRKIGHIRGPDYSVADNRFKGYKDALINNGIEYNEDFVEKDDASTGGSKAAMKRLLDKNQGITSVFCWNDWAAFGSKEAIEEYRLKVPNDISIVGYDNIDVSARMNPSLTTVDIPRKKIGHFAVERLYDLVNNIDSEPVITELPTKLVERSSVRNIL